MCCWVKAFGRACLLLATLVLSAAPASAQTSAEEVVDLEVLQEMELMEQREIAVVCVMVVTGVMEGSVEKEEMPEMREMYLYPISFLIRGWI